MKLKTKKTLGILTILVLMLSILPLNISKAATTPTFSVANVEVERGGTITVQIKLDQDIPDATSINIQLGFDKDKLEVTGRKAGQSLRDFGSPTVSNVDAANNQGFVAFPTTVSANEDGDITNKTIKAGVIGEVTFKAKDTTSGVQNLNLQLVTLKCDRDGASGVDIKGEVSTQASSTVTVIVPVTGVTISGPAGATSSTLNVNETSAAETAQLTATVAPADADQNVTWSSSNTAVATVSNTGLVTAVRPGTAVITATKGTQSASYNVTVTATLEAISLNETTLNILKNQTADLTVTYNPTYTDSDKTITWESSDSTIAKVENGKVTGLKAGTATITAKSSVAGVSDKTCTVTVTEVPLNSIALNKTDFELNRNQSETLSVIYNPNNTTDSKNVTWTSSDSNIVKVDNNGKVTAVKVGEATITAKVGSKTATVKITVPEVKLTDIKLEIADTKIEVGSGREIHIISVPENTSEDVNVVFTSSDETIAKVDEWGLVEGLKPGKVTITAKVNDKFEKSIELEIVEKAVEEKPETPANGEQQGTEKDGAGMPDTGDIAIGVFAVLMIVSLAGIVVVAKKMKK